MRIGYIALGRPTFDVPFATETSSKALKRLLETDSGEVVGKADVMMDGDAVVREIDSLMAAGTEAMVVFQATFADTTLVREVTDRFDGPLVLWATPEPRTGGRLRLNSFCGINLAAYALRRAGADYRWVYRSPDDPASQDDLVAALTSSPEAPESLSSSREGEPSVHLNGKRVGILGLHPDGFDPCDYDAGEVMRRFGVETEPVALESWFDAANGSDDEAVEEVESRLRGSMEGLEDVDQSSLGRSLSLYTGLQSMIAGSGWDGVATRCWPECFTEHGGAACAANSMLTSEGTPGCCEADVYGVLTALLLGGIAGTPPFVADLVDLGRDDDTVVFWHCGSAPVEMAADTPVATIHSNRKLPLLNEFRLKPGRVTIARLSQSGGRQRLVVGGAEMIDEPLPYSGTSGVARTDTDVAHLVDTIMSEGLEHHYGIVYGDHVDEVINQGVAMGLDVVRL